MSWALGPFTITGASFDIKYPTSPPSNTRAVVLANYSQFLIGVTISGAQSWLPPWTANMYATGGSGSAVVGITSALSGATPPIGAASYLTAEFYADGDPLPSLAYPLTLQPAASERPLAAGQSINFRPLIPAGSSTAVSGNVAMTTNTKIIGLGGSVVYWPAGADTAFCWAEVSIVGVTTGRVYELINQMVSQPAAYGMPAAPADFSLPLTNPVSVSQLLALSGVGTDAQFFMRLRMMLGGAPMVLVGVAGAAITMVIES